VTRAEWEKAARQIWEAAFSIDPIHTMDVTRAVVGGEVFAWTAINIKQIRALHRGLFATARLS